MATIKAENSESIEDQTVNNNNTDDSKPIFDSDVKHEVGDANGDEANDDANDNVNNSNNDNDGAMMSDDNNTNDNYKDNNNESIESDTGKTNLIVNYLPQQMTDDEFEQLFQKFGAMKSCKIVRNRGTGYSYGFGFVDFETHEQALKAIEELNGHELETKKIKVAFARPAGQDIKQANLYIKNVPSGWSQDDVRKVFEPYGNIIQVRVLGNNRGVAFVLYDLRKQAEDALEALNGVQVEGCEAPFEIKFAADKKQGGDKGSGGGGNKGSNNSGNNNRRDRNDRRGGRNNRNNRGDSSGRRDNNNRKQGQDRNRGGGRGGNLNNQQSYQQNNQYSNNSNNNNNNNGVGPMRQQSNRMNRFVPFVPVQQQAPMMTNQMAPMAAYGGYQQPMIPGAYMMAPATQPMMAMNPQITQQSGVVGATGTMSTMPAMGVNPYQAPAQMQMGYAPPPAMNPNAMSSMYSVGSGTSMSNAGQMQTQLGTQQAAPMNARATGNNHHHQQHHHQSNSQSSGGNFGDDGVTLFVYNIGPDSDETELRSMFEPYGHVVKCNVVRKTPGGETKGFGFVTMKTRDQANGAIGGLNGSMRNGRALQVSFKK